MQTQRGTNVACVAGRLHTPRPVARLHGHRQRVYAGSLRPCHGSVQVWTEVEVAVKIDPAGNSIMSHTGCCSRLMNGMQIVKCFIDRRNRLHQSGRFHSTSPRAFHRARRNVSSWDAFSGSRAPPATRVAEYSTHKTQGVKTGGKGDWQRTQHPADPSPKRGSRGESEHECPLNAAARTRP